MSDAAWFVAGGALAAYWIAFAAHASRCVAKSAVLADALTQSETKAGPHARAAAARTATGLSVVVTACNEERDIETTVRRFLAQRGEDLELVVVDDRSTDATSAILDRLAAEFVRDRRLSVVHNRVLPAGRLGKCHACALGAEKARGRWILFADGDVAPSEDDVLARTVAFAEREGLDHVAVFPDLRPQGVLQEGVTGAFGIFYLVNVRADALDDPEAPGGAGVGAFNLVRRTAYDRIGGHSAVMMDTADDWKLGRLLKESGARQRLYFGTGLVYCPWQRGAWNVVRVREERFRRLRLQHREDGGREPRARRSRLRTRDARRRGRGDRRHGARPSRRNRGLRPVRPAVRSVDRLRRPVPRAHRGASHGGAPLSVRRGALPDRDLALRMVHAASRRRRVARDVLSPRRSEARHRASGRRPSVPESRLTAARGSRVTKGRGAARARVDRGGES
jgi:glycosyltransferase involved in cell wall biosynthesis